MKLCLINDQHFGVRNDSSVFHKHFRKYYEEQFFPYLDSNKDIRVVFDLGDTFDKRKHIDFSTLKMAREVWFDELKRRNIELHMIIGNHSTYFKNTNEVNSPNLLLKDYDNVIIYDKPTDVEFGGKVITMMPWIASDNYQECIDHIEKTDSKIIMGHLAVEGYKMYKNSISHGGMKKEIFSKFDRVYSGHFHHKNGIYLGAPMEYNWNDFDDPRGFHIFDTETEKLEYIINPLKIHKKIVYDESIEVDESIHNCFLKIVVKEKKDPIKFEKFIERIEFFKPADYQILEDKIQVDLEDIELEDGVEDTLSTIISASNRLEENSEEVKIFLCDLYRKALNESV